MIQRDTIQTAKLVASIDQVSGGRFLFGIGGGWNAEEIESHGTVFATRMQKMREQIEAMKQIWTKRQPEYNGDIVKVADDDDLAEAGAEAVSACIARRRLPWAARRAIRYGDGWYRTPAAAIRRSTCRGSPDGSRGRPRSAIPCR